jgi:hypothetical protein
MKISEALRGISILLLFLCYNEVCVDMIPEQRTQNPAAAWLGLLRPPLLVLQTRTRKEGTCTYTRNIGAILINTLHDGNLVAQVACSVQIDIRAIDFSKFNFQLKTN